MCLVWPGLVWKVVAWHSVLAVSCADDVCVWDHAACPTTTTTNTINHALAHGSAESAQQAVATHLLFTLARLQLCSCDEHVAGVAAGQTCRAALILMRSGHAFWPQRRSEGKTVSAHAAHPCDATHTAHASCVLSFFFHSSHQTRHRPLRTYTTHHNSLCSRSEWETARAMPLELVFLQPPTQHSHRA
jgi:hypothetical protein